MVTQKRRKYTGKGWELLKITYKGQWLGDNGGGLYGKWVLKKMR